MSDARREARESYEAGDFERSRKASLTGLELNADDLELLRFAGKSSVELEAQDAVGILEKLVALEPTDHRGWHDLGEALAAEGRVQEATDAFRKAVELQPDDPDALIDYGHSAFASGKTGEAIEALERATEITGADAATLRSLVGMYRQAGRMDEALSAAERLAGADADDVLAALEIADLSLSLDRLDDALGAYVRMRAIDDEPEHDIYAVHGMIQVAMRRGDWARALELAEEGIRIDPSGRTESLVGYFAAQASGRPDQGAGGRAEVDAALAAAQAEHRRLHSEQFAAF